jgi:hypothetical protein
MKRVLVSIGLSVLLLGCGGASTGGDYYFEDSASQQIDSKHKTIRVEAKELLKKVDSAYKTLEVSSKGDFMIVVGEKNGVFTFYKIDVKKLEIVNSVEADTFKDSDLIAVRATNSKDIYSVKVTHSDGRYDNYTIDASTMKLTIDDSVKKEAPTSEDKREAGGESSTKKEAPKSDDRREVASDLETNSKIKLKEGERIVEIVYSPKKYGGFAVIKEADGVRLDLYGMEDPSNPKYEYTIDKADDIKNIVALGDHKISYTKSSSEEVVFDYLNQEPIVEKNKDDGSKDDSGKKNIDDNTTASNTKIILDENLDTAIASVVKGVEDELLKNDNEKLISFKLSNKGYGAAVVSRSETKGMEYLMLYGIDGDRARYEFTIDKASVSKNGGFSDIEMLPNHSVSYKKQYDTNSSKHIVYDYVKKEVVDPLVDAK